MNYVKIISFLQFSFYLLRKMRKWISSEFDLDNVLRCFIEALHMYLMLL